MSMGVSTLHSVLESATVAQAAAGGGAAGMIFQQVAMFGALFAIIYFMLIRPQAKQRKEHEALLAGLKAGDKVITQAGILGEIKEIRDDIVTLEVAYKVNIRVQRATVVGLQSGSAVTATAGAGGENKA
jgi:preprotein translocase subunit YajC